MTKSGKIEIEREHLDKILTLIIEARATIPAALNAYDMEQKASSFASLGELVKLIQLSMNTICKEDKNIDKLSDAVAERLQKEQAKSVERITKQLEKSGVNKLLFGDKIPKMPKKDSSYVG